MNKIKFLIFSALCLSMTVSVSDCSKKDETKPATLPKAPVIEGLTASADYYVEINGKAVFTEHYEVATPKEPNITDAERSFVARCHHIGAVQKIAIARYISEGGANTVTVQTKKAVKSCTVRPKSKHAETQKIESNKFVVNDNGSQYLYLEIDDLPPLLLVSMPKETETPAAGAIRFGPGVHRPGRIDLKSGDRVYIDEGAIVYGQIYATGCTDLRISGRGILETPNVHNECIHLTGCSNVLVEGLMVRRNRVGWMVVPEKSEDITFRNLQILGFSSNNDGIDVLSSKKIRIENCFLRNTDDCIAIKTHKLGGAEVETGDINVSRCVMFGFDSADGITVGFEIFGPLRGVTVSDCDILGGRGEGTTGGHSAMSVICDGTGPVTDIVFDNIRIEDILDRKNFEITVTDGTHYPKYVIGRDLPPGKIRNVTIRNVHWESNGFPFHISGHGPDNQVENVTFENCSVAGKPLKKSTDANFVINGYVSNIQFR